MKVKDNLATWRKFFPFLRPHFGLGFVLLILLIIGNLGALTSPYFLKIIIDQVLMVDGEYMLLVKIVLILFTLYIFRILAAYYADYLYTVISNRITVDITNRLFSHMLRLPISYFIDNSVGAVVYRINNEVGQVRRAFTGSIINIINNVITAVALVVLMLTLDAGLFVVVALLYPVLLFIMRYFSPSIRNVVQLTREEESRMTAFLTERFTNIKFIKLFHTFRREAESMSAQINGLVGINLKTTVLTSASNNLSVFLLAIIPLVVLIYGGKEVLAGAMTLGTLIAFLQYANKLHEPFKNIVNLYVDLVKTAVSIRRIFELLEEPAQFPEDDQAKRLSEPLRNIVFRRVAFSFGHKPILHEFDLEIEAGKHYALVGPSGCGKSTLIQLLTKLHSPKQGVIAANGTDLRDVSFESWMENVALCSQEKFVLAGTIIDNIRYGNENDVNDPQFARLMESLQLDPGALTESLHQAAGEGGVKISGGQRQKIAIARCVLKKPRVLILDEATSEIDSDTEARILDYLVNDSGIATTIIVSHRLSSLRYADEIICMKDGRVCEAGTFDSLVSGKGEFERLFRNQMASQTVLR